MGEGAEGGGGRVEAERPPPGGGTGPTVDCGRRGCRPRALTRRFCAPIYPYPPVLALAVRLSRPQTPNARQRSPQMGIRLLEPGALLLGSAPGGLALRRRGIP